MTMERSALSGIFFGVKDIIGMVGEIRVRSVDYSDIVTKRIS